MPWAVGNDAVPEQAGAPAAVPIAVAAALPVRVMVVFDYARWKDEVAALTEIRDVFLKALPGISVATRASSPTPRRSLRSSRRKSRPQPRQPLRPLQTRPTPLPRGRVRAVMQKRRSAFTSVTTVTVPRETVALTLTTRSCASVHWPPVGMRATSRRLLRRRVVARLAAREVARTVSPRPRLRRKPRLRARLGRSRPALCVRSLQRMAPAGRVPTVTWFTPLSRSRAMPWQWPRCWSALLPSGTWAKGFSTALPICLMETRR